MKLAPEFERYAARSHLTIVFEKGSELNMSKYDFKDAKIDAKQGNVVIGEHQNVSNTVGGSDNEQLEELFSKFLSDVKKFSHQDEVEDALDNANKLKAAVEADDKPRAKKIFGWLPTAVQATSTAVEILKLFSGNQ